MHKVLRTFTEGRGRVRVGQIVDGSKYPRLGFLIRRGYLMDVGDDVEPTPREVPEVIEEVTPELVPQEVIEEVDAELEPDDQEAEEQAEGTAAAPMTFGSNADIIDQLAEIEPPAETKTKPSRKKK